jgi:hypothetical protein
LTEKTIARALSIGGHPLFVLPLAIAVVLARAGSDPAAIAWILGSVVGALIVSATYVVYRVRRGDWTDVDVSTREQRPRMYAVAIACTGAACAVLWYSGQPAPVVRGALAAVVLLMLSAASNQLGVKASLHTSFSVYAAAMLWTSSLVLGAFGVLLAIAVAWSRIALSRHTSREVAVGFALGALCSVPFFIVW